MHRLVTVFSVFLFIILMSGTVQASPIDKPFKGVIQKVSTASAMQGQTAQVRIEEGKRKGDVVSTKANPSVSGGSIQLQKGDAVMLSRVKDAAGRDAYYIVDYVRTPGLLILFIVFLIFVLLIGRWKGLFAVVGMILSFVIISQFIIPQILLGNDPILISLMGSLFIIPLTFYVSHGVSRTTHVAVVGTFITLTITGILAYAAVDLVKLTGYAAEEASFLQLLTRGSINIKSLLLAGIIIGTLGVLDDITISQSGIVDRLAVANPKYTVRKLYHEAMVLGRDHIASLVNTLILVYTGAALPLFLLFYNSNTTLALAVNQEIVATEIVRTLVSSIGIIAAVPITTFLAAWYRKH